MTGWRPAQIEALVRRVAALEADNARLRRENAELKDQLEQARPTKASSSPASDVGHALA